MSMMHRKTLETEGAYSLVQCDPMYAAYSGYAYTVEYQAPTLCNPKTLRGFSATQLEEAKKFLRTKAAANVEGKKFAALKKRVTKQLAGGFMPCAQDDDEHRNYLARQGYSLSHRSGSTLWYRKTVTAPTLFEGQS